MIRLTRREATEAVRAITEILEEHVKYKAVEVIDNKTHEVKHTVLLDPPRTERMAEKVERGMGINLDWDQFYTRLVPVDE